MKKGILTDLLHLQLKEEKSNIIFKKMMILYLLNELALHLNRESNSLRKRLNLVSKSVRVPWWTLHSDVNIKIKSIPTLAKEYFSFN